MKTPNCLALYSHNYTPETQPIFFTFSVNFCTLSIIEVATNKEVEATIRPLEQQDLSKLNKRRYFFDWKEMSKQAVVYKLCPDKSQDIKGLIAVLEHPNEFRLEIKLITASRENVILQTEKGKKLKEYENIARSLLSFSAQIALAKFGKKACLSLVPKTQLRDHYIKEYKMKIAGQSLYLDGKELQQLAITHKL